MDPIAAAQAQQLLLQAQKQLDHGRWDKAEQTLLEAIQLNADLGPAYNNLGLIYFGRRQLYEAAHAFNNAIMLMPGSGLPHNNLAMVLEGGGRLDQAIEHYEMAYSLEPQVPEFLGNLVRARLAQGDFSDEVVYLLHELVFLDTRPDWVQWAQDEIQLTIPKAQYLAKLESEIASSESPQSETADELDDSSLTPPENLSPPPTTER